MAHAPQRRKRQTLQGYERQYEHLKEQLRAVGYVLQGSVLERWMEWLFESVPAKTPEPVPEEKS